MPPDGGPDGARRLISTGSPFEETFAYSRAVVQGEWCFVAGTTGYDYAAMLSLDEAAWINGEVIRVDGGEHISGASR